MNEELVEQYTHNLTVYTFNNLKVLVDGSRDAFYPSAFYLQFSEKSFQYISAPSHKTVQTAIELRNIGRRLRVISHVAKHEPSSGRSGPSFLYWNTILENSDLRLTTDKRCCFNRNYMPYILHRCPIDGVLLLYVLRGDDNDSAEFQKNLTKEGEVLAARQHGLVSLLVYLPPVKGANVTRVLLTGTCTHKRVVEGLRRARKIPFIAREEYRMDEGTARMFCMNLRTSDAVNPAESNPAWRGYPIRKNSHSSREKALIEHHILTYAEVVNLMFIQRQGYGHITHGKNRVMEAYFDVVHLPSDMRVGEIGEFLRYWRSKIYFVPTDERNGNLLGSTAEAHAFEHGLRWHSKSWKIRVVPSHTTYNSRYLGKLGLASCCFRVAPASDSNVLYESLDRNILKQMFGSKHEIHERINTQ